MSNSMKSVLLLCLLGPWPTTYTKTLKVLELPGIGLDADGKCSKCSKLRHKKPPSARDFPEISVCMRFYMNMLHAKDLGSHETLVSVMMGLGGGNSDEFLTLILSTKDGKDKSGRLYGYFGATYKGMAFWSGGDAERVPHKWYSLCAMFKYTEAEGSTRLYYVNGEEHFSQTGVKWLPDTVWVKGSNLTVGGREFPLTGKHLEGMVTDVQMFSKFLSIEEAVGYTTCTQFPTGDIATWNLGDWEQFGVVGEYDVDTEDICSKAGPRGGTIMLLPAQLSWYGGRDMCRRFGGRLHIDSTKEGVMERSAPMVHKGEKVRKLRCERVWLGASDQQEETFWRDSETNEVLDIEDFWAGGQPNGVRIQNCAGIWEMDGETFHRYDDGGCEKERQCSLCNFGLPPRAKLRGLCTNEIVDVYYTMLFDHVTNLPYYQGFRNSRISYNEDYQVWMLTSKYGSVTGTSSQTPINSMGTGGQTWQFSQDLCNDNINGPKKLKMTVCSSDQFTCSKSGACISMDKRCDQFPNCDDFSDEYNCNLVIRSESYVKDFTPFTLDDKDQIKKVEVLIKAEIISILEIDEVGQIFSNQFKLHMTWYDFRLKFHNMKVNLNMNTLTIKERGLIWVPQLVFSNTEEKINTKNDGKAQIVARRDANFTLSEDYVQDNINIFEGKENPMIMSRVYDVEWICIYDMRWYPFDTQTCSMVLETMGNSGEFVQLVVDKLDYLGPKDLTQYFIRDTRMKIAKDQSVDIKVVLGRRLLGEILTTYIPTILLVIISHMTNYFKPFFFEAVVSVNLTVMLVLATMFISVSQNLPKTSYIKMVDVWLIFNLLLPFIEVLLHTYIDTLRSDEGREINHHGKPRKVGDNDGEDEEEKGEPVEIKIPSRTISQIHPHDYSSTHPHNYDTNISSVRSSTTSTKQLLVKEIEGVPNLNLISRNEKTQVKALKEFYEKNDGGGDENSRLKVCMFIGHVGMPALVISFVTIYWTIGLMKYSSGEK